MRVSDKTRCGTEAVHCIDPEPQFMKTSCQVGFSGCTIVPSPTCWKGSGTASNGRRVGYYQGWNSRERTCDKVPPRLINTRGLTLLFYSFAFFDPTSFQMMPMNVADVSIYGEFTALKRNGLQTWIVVGGVSPATPDAGGRSIIYSRSTRWETTREGIFVHKWNTDIR
jgi:chitinase